MIPYTRTPQPEIISKEVLAELNCARFFETAKKQHAADNLTVMLTPGYLADTKFVPSMAPRVVTDADRPMSDFGARGPTHYTIQLTYTVNGLDPYQKLYRSEFLMQTLEIIDRLYDSAVSKSILEDLETTRGTLSKLYTFEELWGKTDIKEQVDNLSQGDLFVQDQTEN
jgi:hypothetical protein